MFPDRKGGFESLETARNIQICRERKERNPRAQGLDATFIPERMPKTGGPVKFGGVPASMRIRKL